jgi:hypothetical protein
MECIPPAYAATRLQLEIGFSDTAPVVMMYDDAGETERYEERNLERRRGAKKRIWPADRIEFTVFFLFCVY